MPNLKAAITNVRKIKRRTLKNRHERSKLKTLNKKSLQAPDMDPAQAATLQSEFSAALDKAAKHKVIHKNKANRLKSKAAKRTAQAQAAQA